MFVCCTLKKLCLSVVCQYRYDIIVSFYIYMSKYYYRVWNDNIMLLNYMHLVHNYRDLVAVV